MKKFLPVGIQNFERMIKGNFVYVDKTRFIYDMARPAQGFYFLSRPRRFGKSLTVSTLDYLFRGRGDLFEGLFIYGTDWKWETFPILKLDFNVISFQTPVQLQQSLLNYIEHLIEKNEIENPFTSLKESFATLITGLYTKFNSRVVVLIDEYDKPIIEHIGKGDEALEIARQNRDVLKEFLGVLKGGDVSESLRLVFITGISKFSRVSIFSDLNNLNDISMHRGYGEILGYTHQELVGSFEPFMDSLGEQTGMSHDKLIGNIRKWYNGYKFTPWSEPVYNPFSIVKLFESERFGNFWFETATPSFLSNLIREKQYPVADIEMLKLPEELFTTYELENLQLEPLLFQTGYITLDRFEDEIYHMRYPNLEVKNSFLFHLFNYFTRPQNGKIATVYRSLHHFLKESRMEEFIEAIRSILGSIPYVEISGKDEAYYHTVFYLSLSASGTSVHPEVLSSRGRMNLVVEFDEKVYIMELKCNQSWQKAIKQILEKGYHEKFLQTGKEIYLMGINFDTEKRTVEGWKCGKFSELTAE